MQACDNAAGSVKSHTGYTFPSFIILDRGITLSQWLQTPRSHSAVVAMAAEILQLLGMLHRAGRVHRDIKPGNLLLVVHTQQWRLLDFGIVAQTGANRMVTYLAGTPCACAFVRCQRAAAPQSISSTLLRSAPGLPLHRGLYQLCVLCMLR